MIQVNIKTTSGRKTITTEVTNTPRSVFEEIGLSTAGQNVSLDGQALTVSELGDTFEALGVKEGSAITIRCVVKADGANN